MSKSCSIKDCIRPFYAKTWCKKHYTHNSKFGYPEAQVKWSSLKGNSNSSSGSNVGYIGMHIRLKKKLKSPQFYDCEHCKELADDWAYTHECNEEKTDNLSRTYCLHFEHYIPLCRSCHRIFDTNYEPSVAVEA